MMKRTFDCIIVGGGIVGLTAALALAQHNLNIALVEEGAFNFDYNLNEFDVRVSAITRSSENIFKNLNIWSDIAAERITPYHYMKVWDEKGDGQIEFSAAKIAQPNLGHIIENRIIQKNLYYQARNHLNLTIFNPVKCVDFYHQNEKIVVLLDGGIEITTQLMVGSDGANSWVRNRAEFELDKKDYNHHAIVATINTELPHSNTARQRFLNDSILALLPLPDAHVHSIVWCTLPEKAKALTALPETEFASELAHALSGEMGDIQIISERHSFPLSMRHVKKYIKPRIALMGDAGQVRCIIFIFGTGIN